MEQTASTEQSESAITQASYRPTGFEEASWPLVGERFDTTTFTSLRVNVLPGSQMTSDPMFADFGGRPERAVAERWHNNSGEADPHAAASMPAEVDDGIPRVTLKEEELQQMLAQARNEGLAQGQASAGEQAAAQHKIMQERIDAFFADFKSQQQESLKQLEAGSVQLALDMARKIIETTVEINPEYIINVVREALEQTGSAAPKKVRVSAQDLEFIELIGLAKSMKEYDGSWQFVADETVKMGCVVETSAGEVDFQLDKAWDRIKNDVVKVLA